MEFSVENGKQFGKTLFPSFMMNNKVVTAITPTHLIIKILILVFVFAKVVNLTPGCYIPAQQILYKPESPSLSEGS